MTYLRLNKPTRSALGHFIVEILCWIAYPEFSLNLFVGVRSRMKGSVVLSRVPIYPFKYVGPRQQLFYLFLYRY